ncbi:Stk1 family PASTA domain-containing Ser/Thr kinase [Salinibacillus xinjiangensis]|uniref:Serine/threonine-protein kinase PrkC n=1 Tax=Salinibacillus xinjiangensis TaxID=1229268 RepID=A0A6G1X3P2_9BACI|nr:Stk1 family PASTA domain-containing Ser/Thr kinase [Salinibacillus xinjiangensis]MRG85448.1 Stk1 family PASTA domain-containing Ser/Thr kinase [Salinibacillus xinjiangensis]
MFRGQVLSERYKIIDTIGGGGMANVYVARDLILERDVAIKVLRMEYADDDEFIERFRREAQSTISLSHPNIVNIYDVGEEDDNIYYIVMEYVKGMTLKQYIQNYGPLPVDEAIDIMKQVTSAITHAHNNEIIHRDLKPQNILIDQSGTAKVTDFGIAMALSRTSVTQTNSVLGSVHYLSPEQARGGTAIKKSDIYSLGIVFFEMLTGRLPFSGESAVSIALKHLQSETPSVRRWVPEIPQSVENIVLKATAKNPFHRYEYAYQFEEDLATALLPSRMNEKKFIPPQEEGEETKAIPVITNDHQIEHLENDETVVHKKQDDVTGEPKKKKKNWKVWTFSILGVLVAAAIVALFILPKLFMPEEVEVADVEGLTYEEAFNQLSDLGLNVENESRNSDTVEEGYVIESDPSAGSLVKEGQTVTIFTSIGKEKEVFGDYVGEQISQIRTLLEGLGYSDVREFNVTSDKEEGTIISQDPMPEAEVVPEETTVRLEVSSGPETISLRSLKGMTLEEVDQYISENELTMSSDPKEEFSDEVEEGKVISQIPEAYTEVEKGTEISVVISKGAEPKPKSFSVEYTVKVEQPTENEQGSGNNEEEQPPKQQEPQTKHVVINIEDIDGSTTYVNETIENDKTYQFEVTVAPGQTGSYQIIVDGTSVKQDEFSNPEGGD